jgi:hypothetical protein
MDFGRLAQNVIILALMILILLAIAKVGIGMF